MSTITARVTGGSEGAGMFTWQTLRASDGRVDKVDGWRTLGEAVWEMACWSWEEPGNGRLSFVVEEATGLVVATAIYGPDGELLLTLSDGRRLRFPVPERYRAATGVG